MGRTKGTQNKSKQPEVLSMSTEQRVNLLADIILEIVMEEQAAKD